ncbi:uncharacterized protein BO66DRAFT_369501 [Aspergillus aculeatinus CBS 121060]|uniref:Uncharacterized protein n=1 Tax=Aspergillus aculeatinus CBS 121060 TaxID=1448322 RepID=A0ACD1HFD5_9EURO|nr:hypothetical protein BO66DRAFT_369501 [Aspergillus aculeatinus CBS 121060]RAH72303.1 hypothetical protein BO66DRAFT_369501 [Aspergillus aculeatinus CBS 121060]
MEDIRPTARWANRMLRPLTSVYHRLEKHHEIRASVADAKTKVNAGNGSTERKSVPSNRSSQPATDQGCTYPDEEPDDPAWIPGRPPSRRIRHNYSTRGQRNGARRRTRVTIQSPEAQRTLPGAIEIATPLITGRSHGSLDASSSIRKQLFRNVISATGDGEASDNRKGTRSNNSSFPAYQGSWKEVLDICGNPGFVDIARYLDQVLLKFLNNTRETPTVIPQHAHITRGPRSLMSMALRRLPEFIAEEQILQDEIEEDGEVDMCDAYFTELEAFYASNDGGWQPLREAARARGIHLISDMIRRGWIPRLAACRLLKVCLENDEFDAFESLLSRCLLDVATYEYPSAFEPSKASDYREDPIRVLRVYYSRVPSRRSFFYDELAKLLTRGVFPPEWMVTSLWKKCVDGAILSVSAGDGDSAAATKAVEAIVLASAGIYSNTGAISARWEGPSAQRSVRPKDTRASTMNASSLLESRAPCPVPIQDALSNLIASLVTALCGMCITRTQASGPDERTSGLKIRQMVTRFALNVQRAIGIVSTPEEIQTLGLQSLRRGYVLLGDFILQANQDVPYDLIVYSDALSEQHMNTFCLSLAGQQDTIKELAEFVQQVFHCCGHARKSEPTRTPQEIKDTVTRLARLTSLAGVSLLLDKVAAETAMLLAEITLDEDDHVWALEMQGEAISSQQEQRAATRPTATSEAFADQPGDTYRWEDSIGEWVANTPASKPLAARPKLTSNLDCSMSSSASASPAPSETMASSVTSSAPSLTGKRERAQQDLEVRSPKRLRSASLKMTRGSSGATRHEPKRPVESESAPVAARTRTALRDLCQAKNRMIQSSRTLESTIGSKDLTPVTSGCRTVHPLPRIEVVIVNSFAPALGTTRTQPDAVLVCRKSARLARASISAPVPAVTPTAIATESNRRTTRPRRARLPPPPPRPPVKSYFDEDSDDELSFLA